MASNTTTGRDDSSTQPVRQRVSRWLNRALLRDKAGDKEVEPPAPLRRQTPSLRRQLTGPSETFPRHPQEASPFFSQLPPELRRDILLYTFGNRTIHVEWAYGHSVRERVQFSVSGGAAHAELPPRRRKQTPRGRESYLQSSVCHRNPPWIPPHHPWWDLNWHKPDIDRCMEGEGFFCRQWLGEWPVKCQVGALGWLLSCRKAYDEGIDLLYTTNTFHLSHDALPMRLREWIVQPRLAQMTSFEIVLPVSGPDIRGKPFRPSNLFLSTILSMLAESTGIKRLYLCLLCGELRRRVLDVDVSNILGIMDAFVRETQLESTVLQMDPIALKQLAAKACLVNEDTTNNRPTDYKYQMWRSLDGDEDEAKVEKRQCFFPQKLAPLRDPASPKLGQSRGYWIMQSLEQDNLTYAFP